MQLHRTLWIVLACLVVAACGPLEGEPEWLTEADSLPQVLPDVSEPSPPSDTQLSGAAVLLAEDQDLERASETTLPSPAEELLLTPNGEQEPHVDGEGDGRGQG